MSGGATCQPEDNGFIPTSNDLAPIGRPIDTSMADCGYVHHIVLDCSSICFIDTVGAKIINQVHIIYVVPDLPIGLTG